MHLLPDLIGTVLKERFDKFSSQELNSRIYLAEWRLLTNMVHF
jgi:nucleolar pre-ribosomal-associated protein 1